MVVFPLTKKKEKKNSLNDYLLPNKLPQIPPIPSLLIITAGRTIHTYRFDCFPCERIFLQTPLWAKMTNRIIIRQQKKQICVHLSSITFDLHNNNNVTITIYIHT